MVLFRLLSWVGTGSGSSWVSATPGWIELLFTVHLPAAAQRHVRLRWNSTKMKLCRLKCCLLGNNTTSKSATLLPGCPNKQYAQMPSVVELLMWNVFKKKNIEEHFFFYTFAKVILVEAAKFVCDWCHDALSGFVSAWSRAAAAVSPHPDLPGGRGAQPQHLPLPLGHHRGEGWSGGHLQRGGHEARSAVLGLQRVRSSLSRDFFLTGVGGNFTLIMSSSPF